KQAMFTTPVGGGSPTALYGPWAFLRTDGTTVILFVSNGKLYFTVKGSATYTEIKIGGPSGTSFTLTSAKAQGWIEGKYFYLVDGVGSLYRVNVNADSTYTAVA